LSLSTLSLKEALDGSVFVLLQGELQVVVDVLSSESTLGVAVVVVVFKDREHLRVERRRKGRGCIEQA
jgi:NADH:ubiquinone oxidoreductase subunit K